ncbi:hypothetical protein CHS0354_022899 [Potamilus streckersoni]|uniref:Uncharacterized protein n=1 Tax=Potamilus streckersoni TaxID=2493646 RepID=A0AAE0S2H2_9BIVA|nr:hypothetical protein CHS0354_022899 [Potamilus streckersoni]
MSTCLILYLFSIASVAMAMTTPSVPTSTEGMMISNMQSTIAQTGSSWNGMNSRGQSRGISDFEAIQAIMGIYNISFPTGINPAMTGRMGGMIPVIGMGRLTQGGGSMDRSWGGRGAVLDGRTRNVGRANGGMGRGSGGIGGTNSGMEWPSGGMGPRNAIMPGLNGRGINSGMGWQGGNGGIVGGNPGGMDIGMNLGMGSGGRRSNVDKTIRTQATLNSQDGALLSKAGAGCTADWTHVNGGVDPFCIRLLMMYPNRGM